MLIEGYYGPLEEGGHLRHSSLGLLEDAKEDVIGSLPARIMFISVEMESSSIEKMSVDFLKKLRERLADLTMKEVDESERTREVMEYVNVGHNHLSSYLSLMSGKGEEWGHDIVKWIVSQRHY